MDLHHLPVNTESIYDPIKTSLELFSITRRRAQGLTIMAVRRMLHFLEPAPEPRAIVGIFCYETDFLEA